MFQVNTNGTIKEILDWNFNTDKKYLDLIYECTIYNDWIPISISFDVDSLKIYSYEEWSFFST